MDRTGKDGDTVKLLKECDSGIKMGISAIDDVIDDVENTEFKALLRDSKAEHERLKSEITGLLNQHNDEGKDPNPMAKGMSWIKTNMKIAMDRDDTTVADLITDGCNMGVKSLSRYLNQYKSADTKSRDITGRLVRIEDRLVTDVRQFL
ncbi:MAG: hypothetical protein K2J41_04370 [Eubacterium sp.]|nr:hypothetical protein [Eubacterium sp.]